MDNGLEYPRATFPSRAEAVAACVPLGRDVLDGKVPDRGVRF